MKLHVVLKVPSDWSNAAKGSFFEDFVSDMLRPMRFKVSQQLRFTGMEIDLLARGIDQQRTILVECKAHRDTLPADTITKIMGNAQIRKADSAWLFSTSELGKDGAGAWDEIQSDPVLAEKFCWFSPQRICDIMIDQKTVLNPVVLLAQANISGAKSATLLVHPGVKWWLVEIIDQGVPTYYTMYDATTGQVVREDEASPILSDLPRMTSLRYLAPSTSFTNRSELDRRSTVARVASGDAWDDLRPSRPRDFVGRDDVIREISDFFAKVRNGESTTRTFAIQGPSGWGKSSLVIKLSDLAKYAKLPGCSVIAIDSRSATNSAFVTEAIRIAFSDSIMSKLIQTRTDVTLDSLNHPLDSDDILEACRELQSSKKIVVIIFDQFEELFAKEALFETFEAIRELSFDLDAKQLPILLGFAWKTDISLPQQHPAYHLWHQLSDRRRTFHVREFGTSDIDRIISRAQRESKQELTAPLKARLREQCQGLPWLLKKLIVHILRRLTSAESQYELLERELDVEVLFREDLQSLNAEQLECLRYVSHNAPVSVPDVEAAFSRDTVNRLIEAKLLVRSGMNYVIYWDIFRDYLNEGRVPRIPWARAFQRDPGSAMRALQELRRLGDATAAELANGIGFKIGPCQNLLSDLAALQLVDRIPNDRYRTAAHLGQITTASVAEHARGQLLRHVVVQEIDSTWERGTWMAPDKWDDFFAAKQPRTAGWSSKTCHYYGANLRRWLTFTGILERQGGRVRRPQGVGHQRGIIEARHVRSRSFLGVSTPEAVLRVMTCLLDNGGSVAQEDLVKLRLRNAISDAIALGLAGRERDGRVLLETLTESRDGLIEALRLAVLANETILATSCLLIRGSSSDVMIGQALKEFLKATHWKDVSARRYGAGLRRFHQWATAAADSRPLPGMDS